MWYMEYTIIDGIKRVSRTHPIGPSMIYFRLGTLMYRGPGQLCATMYGGSRDLETSGLAGSTVAQTSGVCLANRRYPDRL